jgi:hypothetical protein
VTFSVANSLRFLTLICSAQPGTDLTDLEIFQILSAGQLQRQLEIAGFSKFAQPSRLKQADKGIMFCIAK